MECDRRKSVSIRKEGELQPVGRMAGVAEGSRSHLGKSLRDDCLGEISPSEQSFEGCGTQMCVVAAVEVGWWGKEESCLLLHYPNTLGYHSFIWVM